MIGCYILILHIRKNRTIKIGSLGQIKYKRGYYAYIGSAFGRNITVEGRVERHLKLARSKAGIPKWHLDYLLLHNETSPVHIIPVESKIRNECIISKKLEEACDDIVQGFGSSDCKRGCRGHLYYFKSIKNWNDFLPLLGSI